MKIFAEIELDHFLTGNSSALRREIELQADDYLLMVNEAQFLDYLVTKYSVANLTLKISDQYVSASERDIPAELFPFNFNVHAGKSYKRPVVKYHIPYDGNPDLLRCRPNPWLEWTIELTTDDGCICFEIINFEDNSEVIKGSADQVIRMIHQQAQNVSAQVDSYNSHLRSEAEQAFQARKRRILKTTEVLSNLGVPIKRRDHIPSTFAIPNPPVGRRITISKPTVVPAGSKLEPALNDSTYLEILQIIHDVGRQFERMPSTYAGKQEEDLRDHFLLFLEPSFVGTATGETFNKSGKTDILLRHQGVNVFIAECKFWKGPKAYLDTITQLLSYLTWRDSKAAVILFVQNKDFSAVLAQIEPTTQTHENYIAFESKKESTWFNYRFHLTGDSGRELKLATLLFHFP